MGYRSWGGFAPYVSKAEKILKAKKNQEKLAKKGIILEPVILEGRGRTIAKTWWGKAWAENLERYADYSNRIPRGRSYVRNGSILDLKIFANNVTALVSGSRSEPYKIEIKFSSLNNSTEKLLMEKSRSSLDSMQSLLSGEFPEDLKDAFFKQGTGLFPSPKEIKLNCSCPDWAEMCKHVAATLYGVAARLDEKPELFFVLRGIKVSDFVNTMIKEESAKLLKKADVLSNRVIDTEDSGMEELFGISMDIPDSETKQPELTILSKEQSKPVKKRVSTVKKIIIKKAPSKKSLPLSNVTETTKKVVVKKNAKKKTLVAKLPENDVVIKKTTKKAISKKLVSDANLLSKEVPKRKVVKKKVNK
jgi:uncharacterized Zn finger protein